MRIVLGLLMLFAGCHVDGLTPGGGDGGHGDGGGGAIRDAGPVDFAGLTFCEGTLVAGTCAQWFFQPV
ncbi:MAG: hypothetical protein EXR72_00395 [Myxococcales bacterium]|nr:hypothetical protein [Myxococcales bacterium]